MLSGKDGDVPSRCGLVNPRYAGKQTFDSVSQVLEVHLPVDDKHALFACLPAEKLATACDSKGH